MRQLLFMAVIACVSTAAVAQSVEVPLVAGGTVTSDATQAFRPVTIPGNSTIINSTRQIFVQSGVALRWTNLKVGDLYFELPLAGVPSQQISAGSPPTTFDHLSTIFLTPGIRFKLRPVSRISPWVSAGVGWARYSSEIHGVTNKGAVQFGGGVDFKTKMPALSVRAEVRDFLTGEPNFGLVPPRTGSAGLHRHNVMPGAGIVLHF
ncbi:MAG TPA: hypothetical protein VFR24_03960 [Candidatus Angelobacter sp.]|nr:hypothetical protein [Candidatus Angelobacter sp.]